MENDSKNIKRIDNKNVYFVRIKGDIYEQIKKMALEDERTIHWTVNKLLEKQLASAKNNN
jgi:hypothetical protein